VAGCAAAACHNNLSRPAGSPGCEYAAWVHDPHGRAYETTQSPKYRAILDRLRGTAYTADQCLKCHATPTTDGSPLSPDLLSDGVGCESCHGPSEAWRTVHYQGWWKDLDADRKWREFGLFPAKNLSRRMELCTSCHVGSPDKDVNHDLIAAGHPRLLFEYSAYHHLLPRHWREPHEQTPRAADADWEARTYLVGQAGTAKAALDLLQARAAHAGEKTHPWPEFSEYGCYACHHDLQGDDSWRRSRTYEEGLKPGSLPWGTWPLPAVDALAKNRADLGLVPASTARPLVELMARLYPPPQAVAAEAEKLRTTLGQWEAALADRTRPLLTAAQVRTLLRDLIARGYIPDWESATQTYLGLTALYVGLGDLDPTARTAARRQAVLGLREPLRFPLRLDSPRDFRPAAFRDRLRTLEPLFKD
jgi:hypothetical protein